MIPLLTSTDVAPASTAFSTSSLTAVARSRMTAPDEMRCTSWRGIGWILFDDAIAALLALLFSSRRRVFLLLHFSSQRFLHRRRRRRRRQLSSLRSVARLIGPSFPLPILFPCSSRHPGTTALIVDRRAGSFRSSEGTASEQLGHSVFPPPSFDTHAAGQRCCCCERSHQEPAPHSSPRPLVAIHSKGNPAHGPRHSRRGGT